MNHSESLLEGLNDSQREAVTHVDGPLLVLAGAGSGKTRVVTRRVAYLVSRGISPLSIIAITFTNKAAGEMRERVAERLETRGLWISTFHSACARILRRHAAALDYTDKFSIYDVEDQRALAARALNHVGFAAGEMKPRSLLSRVSGAKNQLLGPEDMPLEGRRNQRIAEAFTAYQGLLKQHNAMDYDDLLVNVVRLWRTRPEILAEYQDSLAYVLVDEYQDTNRAQYEIVRMLGAKHHNVCVTGDPDQSIYAWRGADIGNILSFEEDNPGCRTVVLDRNYRSTGVILRAADGVIEHNIGRKEKRMWTERQGGPPISYHRYETGEGEARAIADEILRSRREDNRALGDHAVLYRTTAQSRALEEAMVHAGLPYVVFGGTEFYRRREVKDALSYIVLLLNPGDDLALARVINTPPRRIGNTTIQRLREHAARGETSLLSAVRDAGEVPGLRAPARKALHAFFDLLGEIAQLGDGPVGPLVEAVVENTGLLEHYTDDEISGDRDRADNLKELVFAARQYDLREPDGSVAGFLEDAALVTDTDRKERSAEKVTLMTLHSAKGLEFPVVFIAGLEEGLLPHALSMNDGPDGVEEERRLFYVGLTRAQDHVRLSGARLRERYGAPTRASESCFLDEIPENAMTSVDHTAFSRYDGSSDTERDEDYQGPHIDDDEPGQEFSVGERVFHDHFGEGVIERLTGNSRNPRAIIAFDDAGIKTLALKFARLVRMKG